MPRHKIHPPTRYLAPALAVTLLLVALGVRGLTGDPSTTRPAAGAGTVEVDGRVFAFDAKTCVITDGSFVASGPGTWGGEGFVASVSSSGFEVAFGVTTDVDEPASDAPWWVANRLNGAEIDGETVRATAQVQDRSGRVDGSRTAVAQVTCAR